MIIMVLNWIALLDVSEKLSHNLFNLEGNSAGCLTLAG